MLCCKDCGVELVVGDNYKASYLKVSTYWGDDCKKKSNDTRMYVNGKYIPKTHPLYKAGRYKSFNDAAFSSLENYELTRSGYVYAVTNPAWPDWVKIGMAIDAEDRCNGYQTSSPFRDYQLHHSVYCDDRRSLERKAHKAVERIAEERNGEWFKLPVEDAVSCITGLLK